MKKWLLLLIVGGLSACAQDMKYDVRQGADHTNGWNWSNVRIDLGSPAWKPKSWIEPFFFDSDFTTTVRGGPSDRWGQDAYTFPPVFRFKQGYITGRIEANYALSPSYAARDWFDFPVVFRWEPKWLNRRFH